MSKISTEPFDLAGNIIAALTAAGGINDAQSNEELISSIGQGIAYFGVIALNPVSAGVAIATNAGAAATTLGKVLSDLQNNRVLNISDLASVAGNIMVIGAAVALSLNPASTAAKVTARIARGIGWLGASKMMIDKALPHFSLAVGKDQDSKALALAG